MTTTADMNPNADLLDSLTARLERPAPRRSARALWEEAQRPACRPVPAPNLWREARAAVRTPLTERAAQAALGVLALGGVVWLGLEAAAFVSRFESFLAFARSVML